MVINALRVNHSSAIGSGTRHVEVSTEGTSPKNPCMKRAGPRIIMGVPGPGGPGGVAVPAVPKIPKSAEPVAPPSALSTGGGVAGGGMSVL